jgi:hypothetical protein
MTLYTRGFSRFVTSMTAPIASGWSNIAGWDSHPLRNAAFARRTPNSDIQHNQKRLPKEPLLLKHL